MVWTYPPLMVVSIWGRLCGKVRLNPGLWVPPAFYGTWFVRGDTQPIYTLMRAWSHQHHLGHGPPSLPPCPVLILSLPGQGEVLGAHSQSQVAATICQWINSSLKLPCLNHLHGPTSACAGLNGSSGKVLLALLE